MFVQDVWIVYSEQFVQDVWIVYSEQFVQDFWIVYSVQFVEHFKEDHPGQPPYECPRYGCDKTFIKKQKQQDHIVLHKVKEGDISEDMKKLCVECGKVRVARWIFYYPLVKLFNY